LPRLKDVFAFVYQQITQQFQIGFHRASRIDQLTLALVLRGLDAFQQRVEGVRVVLPCARGRFRGIEPGPERSRCLVRR